MSEQIFQEKPKNTASCVLVKDSGETKRQRDEMKSLIIKILKPDPEDHSIVETDTTYKITQNFARTPATLLIRLKSYKKNMVLYAYNSFEIFHGGCLVTSMRLKNDLDDKKLKEHVENAVKTFKSQAMFAEEEVKQYKIQNAENLKANRQANKVLAKEFSQLGIKIDKDCMVEIFGRGYERNTSGAEIISNKIKVQISDLVKCMRIIYCEKSREPAKSTFEEPYGIGSKYNGITVSCRYSKDRKLWNVYMHNLNLDTAVDLYKKTSGGMEVINQRFGTKETEYPELKVNKNDTLYSYWFMTRQIPDIVKQFNLHVWSVQRD